ncbi:CDP-diacylglycerol--glycerol-3-phosphate 3-phosphatidyltransferase, mitochondrial isoform X2 [Ooceraea biroi]|uniref:CDP-diacylglycerol--glycerol-3-phosphate 3-phosphatidyltransferase n=1 Tax=Ooceraea biroi TaxID=2015173 RepID=A0A026X5D7_OOCBI|nr:CDP-diacylglycerol--glycerol-3-phosphate 3-phosphatidyltransferase, mitochondrial isoform X2 [Ooceraea biroi]EZA62629.1 CDP-diacylglycerol--glycerol-3-phosphate 3-phosphatidyltransferase, mitochondrial [Ooceraea biroi]
MCSLALRIFKRFHEPRLLGVTAEVKTCFVRSLFARHKMHIAMLDEEKLRDVDIHMQQEAISLSWLCTVAPAFPVNGSKITIIHEPETFYSTLLEKCRHAKKRITLASLYIGTGALETELVNVIEQAMNGGTVQVRILMDYMRGSRGKHNSRKMLEPLLKDKYGDRCKVFLYHTPKLRGVMKATMPERFNELVGLQHMKLYMIDDDLIISGANLSNDYFTNRQDRYFVIEDCQELCDFYNKLVEKVAEFSFLLQPDGNTSLNPAVDCHPYKGSRKIFTQEAASRIQTLFQSEIEKRVNLDKAEADTWVFPLVQMGQLNICHDSEVTLKLLQVAPAGATLKLATGYFNLTSEYSRAILGDSRATCHFLTAHPTANGFFNARGIAGGIPAAYTRIEESFFNLCERMAQQRRIRLWEFMKPGWTYHAKGLWYILPGQQKPSLTLIGSPNFGYRSVNRDLETQIAVVTKNEKLQDALHEEQTRLFSCAKPVTRKTFSQQDRIPPAWVCAIVLFFRYYF